MNIKGFFVGIYSFFSILILISLIFLFPKKRLKWRKLWSNSMIKIIGIEIKEIGLLDKSATMMILNHNSMLDILIMESLNPNEISWITKEALGKVPIFGYLFKLTDAIFINPNKKSLLRNLLKRTNEEIDKGKVIGVFPEGTRGDSNEIAPFQKGTKVIAQKLNLKVQPIVLVNTRERLDTKNFSSSSGEVKIIYLDTIKSLNGTWFEDVEKDIKERYLKAKINTIN